MSDLWFPRAERGRRVAGWLRYWALCAALGWSSAALGQSELVRVNCPQLSREQAAEIEARVRASLLTTDAQVGVTITCESESASVRIESSSGDVALETLAMSANLREELLGALDRAFEKLARPPTGAEAPAAPQPQDAATEPEPTPTVAIAALPAQTTTAVPEPRAAPPTVEPRPKHTSVFTPGASAPLFVQGVGELWSSQLAWGAELGSEWSLGSFRYGARAGLLTPVAPDPTFKLLDWEGAAHVGARPTGWWNVQVSLGLGLAWMVVSPRGDATPREVSVVRAPFALLAVSRATRLGHFAIVPELGARLFASERGVTIDQHEQLAFGWFVPRLALGISYVAD